MKFTSERKLNGTKRSECSVTISSALTALKTDILKFNSRNRGGRPLKRAVISRIKSEFDIRQIGNLAFVETKSGEYQVRDGHHRLQALKEMNEAGLLSSKHYSTEVAVTVVPPEETTLLTNSINDARRWSDLDYATCLDYELANIIKPYFRHNFEIKMHLQLAKALFLVQKYDGKRIPLTEIYLSRNAHREYLNVAKGMHVISLSDTQSARLKEAVTKLSLFIQYFEARFPKNNRGRHVIDGLSKRIVSNAGLSFFLLLAFMNDKSSSPKDFANKIFAKNVKLEKVVGKLLSTYQQEAIDELVKILRIK